MRAPRQRSVAPAVSSAALVTLVLLVVLPVLAIGRAALTSATPTGTGGWTIANLGTVGDALAGTGILGATVRFTLGATLVSVVLGAWLAWMTERTDLPGRGAVRVLVLVPLVVPGVLTTAAWRLLLSDRIGLVNVALDLLAVGGPRTDAYTLGAMIWVAGVDGVTLAYLLVASALRGLDPTLEEAALIAAGRGRAALRVVLPLAAPALVAAVLVTAIRNLGRFEGPVILGLPGGVRVLSSQLYLLVQTFPRDAGLAAAFALILLLPSLAVFLAWVRVTAVAGRFATIGGRARPASRRPLRAPALSAVTVFAVLGGTTLLPLGLLAYASLLPFYEVPSIRALGGLTLRNYASLITSWPVLGGVVANTVVAGAVAAVAAVTLGGLAAWVSLRGGPGWRRLLDPLATAPVAVPGVVLALALLWLYLRAPVPLYASLTGVAVGLAIMSLPYATRIAQAALLRIAPELEEASAVSGAGPARTLVRVVAPLALPGLVAGAVLVMTRSAQILSVPLLVGGPGDEVLAVRVLRLYEVARLPELAALGVVMVAALALISVAVAVAQRGRGPTLERDGVRADVGRLG